MIRGTLPSGGLIARAVAKYSDFVPVERYQKRCKIGGKWGRRICLWAFDWYQNRWHWMALNGVMAVILRYFAEFSSFPGALHKSGWRCRQRRRKKRSRLLSHLLMSFLFYVLAHLHRLHCTS